MPEQPTRNAGARSGSSACSARAASVGSEVGFALIEMSAAEAASLGRLDWLASVEGTRPGATPIVMVTGMAKSGTSWLSAMLDSHPEVLSQGEGRFFGRSLLSPKTGARSLEATLRDAQGLHAWLRTSVWTRQADLEEEVLEATAAIARSVLERRLSAAGKRVAVDKTPLPDEHYVVDLHRVLPEAMVIQIVRDGRDVAISSLYHVWNNADKGLEVPGWIAAGRDQCRADREAYLEAHGSIFPSPEWLEAYAEAWREKVSVTRADGQRLFGERYAEVRYEDLHQRPAPELSRLAGLMGVDRSPAVLERCIASASFERLSGGRRPGDEDSTSFFRMGVAGGWRTVFGKEDLRVFEREAGGLLAELRYESGVTQPPASALPPSGPGA